MAIQPLQIPPLVNLPTPDFSVLGSMGADIRDVRMRQQAPDLVSAAFGAQPSQPQQPTAQAAGTPLNAIGTGSTSPGIGSDYGADYSARTRAVESGGDATARNPKSSAGGLYQFTDGTWLQNFDKTFPQYASLAPDQKLALKTDASPQGKAVQDAVFKTFTNDNARSLSAAGVPVNNTSLYAAHFFGAGDAPKVLTANPSAPLASVVQPSTIAANPFLANMTVGQAQQWLASKMGGAPAAQPGPMGQPQASTGGNQPQAAMPGLTPQMAQRIGAMLTNPYTAKLGQALLQKYAAPSYGFQTLPDGTVVRTDTLRGTVQPVYQSSKPQFTTIGTDAWGNQIHGFVDPITRQVYDLTGKPVNLNSGGEIAGPQSATLPGTGPDAQTGDAFLKQHVPPDLQQTVKKLANYELDPRTLSYRGNMRSKLVAWAAQYDPNYDAAQYASRANAIKEFNSGGQNSPAGMITAGNTAIQHLGHLYDDSLNLGGFNNLGPLNSIANKGHQLYLSAEQDPTYKAYSAGLSKFVEEATKFYRGTGGNEADLQRDLADLSAANSPDARKAVIQRMAQFIQSKVNALQDRWKTAMGPTGWMKVVGQPGSDFPIIQAASKSAYDKIMGNAEAQVSKEQGSQSQPKMQTFATPRDVYAAMKAGRLKSGDQFMTPDGQIRVAK